MLVTTHRHGRGRVLLRRGDDGRRREEDWDGGASASAVASSSSVIPGGAAEGSPPAAFDRSAEVAADSQLAGPRRGGSLPVPVPVPNSSLQLVVNRSGSFRPSLPPPRWPPALRTSALPYCRPAWADELLTAQRALYGSRAIRLAAVLDRPHKLAVALLHHAQLTHGSPRVTAAWRSTADVHRFLCHSEEKQALEGPYRLRCPDTSPLVLPWRGGSAPGCGAARPAGEDSGSGRSGGGVSRPVRPTLCEALRCLQEWKHHRVLIQLDLCRLVITHHQGSANGGRPFAAASAVAHAGSPAAAGANPGSNSSDTSTRRSGPLPGWSVYFEACGLEGGGGDCSSRGLGGYDGPGGAWLAICKELMAPVLQWVRRDLLGRYWGLNETPPKDVPTRGAAAVAAVSCCGGLEGIIADPAGLALPGAALQLPYGGGKLSLEWGSEGALLPLRYRGSDDRVILQVSGRRRVLLVPPEHALPALAPFPVLHPYDGYSMPAVAHTLVYDTPGVDVRRAEATLLAAWPGLDQVPGHVSVLDPGDALFVPAGWFLHSELLPPASQQPSQQPPCQNQTPRPAGAPPAAAASPGAQEPSHNIALVLSLSPLPPSAAADSLSVRQPGSEGSGAAAATAAATPASAAPSVSAAGVDPQPADVASATSTAAAAAGLSGGPPSPPRMRARPVGPGALLLQLSRMLESWALAVEVPPGPELRHTLLQLAEYHTARRRLECQQRKQQQQQQQQQREEEQQQQPAISPREWLQLQLHPTFNGHTPRGRVLMELYDMVVQQVAPLAHSVLAAVGDATAVEAKTAKPAAVGAASETEGDDGLGALLQRICERRLLPTDWINQLCRDPEVAREQLLWYDDSRTADEARFPELFRLQVAAKDAAARLTSLRPAALPHTALVAAPLESSQRPGLLRAGDTSSG